VIEKTKNPIRRLRLIALISLASIAALTASSQLLLSSMTSGLDGYARVINLAGRQRMLSQRIASKTQQLAIWDTPEDHEDRIALRDEIERLISLWTESNAALRSRGAGSELKGVNSPDASTLLLRMRPHIESACAAAEEMLRESHRDKPDAAAIATVRERLLDATEHFLPLMDELVFVYEAESRGAVRRLQRAQLGICGLVILVLFVQGFLVFEPAARQVRRQHTSLSEQADELGRLAEIIEKTTNAVILADAEGRVTWVNQGFVRLTGYTLEEVRGRTPGSVLQSELTDAGTVAAMRDALHAGRGFRGEVLNRAKDGRDYWIDLDIQPRTDADGNIIGFMAIESDITPLVLSRMHMQTVFEATADAIVELDRTGNIINCNPAAEAIFGLTRDQIMGRTPHDPRWKAVREDGTDFPGDEHPAMVTLRTGRPIRSFVHGVCHANGDRRWISVSTSAMRDAGGNITGVVASVADVTEQREESRRNEMIIRGANLGTWDWNIETGAVRFNDRWAEMLGYDPSEIDPHVRTWERLVHPDDMPAVMAALNDHLEQRTPSYACEHRLRRKDGSWAWVLDSGQVSERGPDGRAIRASGIHLDITEAKNLERSLREAESRAQDANAAKSQFLANMSHEIRTPMTAIIGYADLIADMPDQKYDPAAAREYARIIQRNGDHLLSIINDILDISKIEAGRMNIERIETDPVRLIFEIDSLMRVRSNAKGISLEIVRETPLPRTIISDPTRIRQILVNLIGNAIKFTELGGVTVRVGFDPSYENGPCLRFEVEDTGIGMTPDQMERLFQAFSQADTSTTRRFGGSGLGLRISKQLCEMLGGTILVSSTPGQGSVFTAIIPTGDVSGVELVDPIEAAAPVRKAESDSDESEPEALPLEGMYIYFAEDGPDNQRLIGFHLRKAGATVTMFQNGLECLNAMTTTGTPEGPLRDQQVCDLVLTDMQMPEMDGYTLARSLRQKGYRGRIVALTAHAMPEDIRKCIESGCDAYASKPINRAELLRVCRPPGRNDESIAA